MSQQTLDNEERSLSGYKPKIHDGFENPNEGKPLLDDQTEYVLRLKSFPRVKSLPTIKEDKQGNRKTVNTDKAICEFEEEQTGNIVTAFFNVSTLNFSDDEAFESAIIKFFKKIQNPLVVNENGDVKWDDYFVVGMRFRSRVQIGKDKEKKPDGRYYLDVPTCRKILESDKHPEALKAAQEPVGIESIREMIKGCKDKDESVMALMGLGQNPATIQKFLAAVKSGEITFQ